MLDADQIPVPDDDDDDILFGDSECFLVHPTSTQVWEIEVHQTEVLEELLPSPEQAVHFVLLATKERKKRIEVRLKDLGPEDQALFEGAKPLSAKKWEPGWIIEQSGR